MVGWVQGADVAWRDTGGHGGGDVGRRGGSDDEGGAVVVLFHNQVWGRAGRGEHDTDGGQVTHVAAPADMGCGIGEGKNRL